MEKRKKPESGDAGAHERRGKGEMTGSEREDREMRRANIAGESYVPPGEASPAYAPGDVTPEAPGRQEKGEMTAREKEARMMRRANIAGESYETPAKKADLNAPGKKR